MRGVEVDGVELVGVDPDGVHEREGTVDLGADALVAHAHRAALHEVGVPRMHLAEVGVAAGGEGAREVQRGRRRVVHVDEPLRVVHPRLGSEVEAVDGVASVGREGDAISCLGVARARLGVLAGETTDLDHRNAGRVGEHDRHREQHPQLVADVLGGDALERLGAVAALEQERLAPADGCESIAEVVALTGEDERRHPAQLLDRGVARGSIRIRGLLGSTHRMQVVETGDGHRSRVPAGHS